jgi:hypothetical protein
MRVQLHLLTGFSYHVYDLGQGSETELAREKGLHEKHEAQPVVAGDAELIRQADDASVSFSENISFVRL